MLSLSHEQKKRIGFTFVMELLKPASPYGRDAVRRIQPFAPGQEAALRIELQNIAKTLSAMPILKNEYTRLEQTFAQVKGIRRSIERIGQDLNEVDLFEIKRFLIQLRDITELFESVDTIADYTGINIEPATPALKLLDPENSAVATFHISSRDFPILAKIRKEKKEVERKLRENPKSDDIDLLHTLRATLASKEQAQEQYAMQWLSEKLIPWRGLLLSNTEAIGRLDLLLQKAKLAATYISCMPEIVVGVICFEEMSNPQLESILSAGGRTFTPLTMEMQTGATVITGANMGGKSVALKTLALNVLLMHCGFYPFASSASCTLFDSIHLISDDLETADRGLSSFGGEIVALQDVLSEVSCGKNALVILDEFARGTNPTEGSAIAKGVCAYMNKQNAFTVMSTHYEGVAALANMHYQVAGLRKLELDTTLLKDMQKASVSARISEIASCMDYGLVRVSADEALPQDALNICRLLSLDERIVDFIEMNMV
ncbi:MAG: hypothetical protein FWC75_07675 [Oscillospiraceae bacterium]|nr:hypothetical protein [Oscillospiraceae bacterium]